jgi:pyruvate/2-oxoglutarate dehydrogenase complex dihydrolipoamide dehydrogenase (E3) component
MKPLPLDIINASAPYEVYWHETSRTYRFKSDFGVVLAIGFDDDDIIDLDYSIQKIIIYGAGVIGCEYASIFIGLDHKVDLINTQQNLAPYQ